MKTRRHSNIWDKSRDKIEYTRPSLLSKCKGNSKDLGDLKLHGMDSYILGSTTDSNPLGASSVKFSLLFNFGLPIYIIVP